MADNFEGKQFGKYFILEKLAVGGMAEIYKAKTFGAEGFEKLLAIKRILPHAAEDKDFITMLIDEAKLSVLLSHANIVQVFDLGKIGTDYFISMEFIHGINLRDCLYRLREKNQKMPTELAVYAASEVCKGLDYAHRKTDSNNQALGIVHRDISPQNILISYEGEVKIVDFGIAKAAMNISHTMAGILKGKIAYMSPEQAMGKTIDARTDIFSLGIVLYEALTGKKLFTGESQFEVLKKIRTTRIDANRLPPSIPAPLRTILSKSLAFNAEERYLSAGDMQVALTKYLYATYTDFSPRKLAHFVKEVFAEELAKEKKAKEKEMEPKTGSISLITGKVQETFVHRSTEKKISATDETRPVTPGAPSKEISATIAAAPRWKKAALGTALLLALTGIGWGVVRWFSKSSPPKVAEAGTLHIDSKPSGADIFINGEPTPYKTPAILDDLKLNRDYLIGLTLDQFGRTEKTVRLENSEPLFVTIPLSQRTGVLNVISDPSGAAILVNNIATGKTTPATLEDLNLNSEYKITLVKPDYLDFEQPITLTDTTPQKISASLQPSQVKGSLVLQTDPPGAKIFLDGFDSGKITPAKLENLDVGKTFFLRFLKDNYQPLEKQIKLEGATPLAMIEKLTPVPAVPVPAPQPKVEQPKVEPSKPAPPPKPIVEKPKPVIEKPKPLPEKPAPKKEEPAAAISGVGNIRINSNPSGADVFINGERKGVTPLVIKTSAGAVRVLVTKGEELLPCRETVSLKPEATETVQCSLGPLYGRIDINTDPPRADVYFNGKKLDGKTPVVIKKVNREKQHTLRIEMNGYKPWSKAFDLRDSETKSFNVELERS